MSITKNGNNEIIFTPISDTGFLAQAGALRSDLVIVDHGDVLKQVKFDPSAQATNTTTTLKSGANSADVVITLPATSGTLATTASGNSWVTMQTDAGTSPVADNAADTLILTSSDSTVTITGDAAAESVNFAARAASGSVSGIITTGVQTLAGNKTFSGTVSASNLSGTNTGDITLAAVGSSANANGASLSGQILTLQPTDGSSPGVINATTQTIGGAKTFSNNVTAPTFIGNLQGTLNTPSLFTEWFDDFDGSNGGGSTNWATANVSDPGPLDTGHIGLAKISTTTSSTGVGYILKDTHYAFGGGAVTIEGTSQLDALSDGTNTYLVRIGMSNDWTGVLPTTGAWFEYTNGTNSGNWVLRTASAGTPSDINSSTAAVAGAWFKWKITINAAATSVGFYINDVLIGTSTTSIPSGVASNKRMTPHATILKSLGATARLLYVDYVWYRMVYTAAR